MGAGDNTHHCCDCISFKHGSDTSLLVTDMNGRNVAFYFAIQSTPMSDGRATNWGEEYRFYRGKLISFYFA